MRLNRIASAGRALRELEHSRLLNQARWLRRQAFKQAWTRATGLPMIRNVQLQTHSRCNARCAICPRPGSWHEKNPGYMSDALFLRILDQLEPFAFCINRGRINPYLMQEPLLDRALFHRIRLIQQRFPGAILGLATNAVALDQEAARELVELLVGRPHVIWISHHGADAETVSRVMKIDGERATRNIVRLARLAAGRLKLELRGAGWARDGGHQLFTQRSYQARWRALFERERIDARGIRVVAFAYHDRAGNLRRPDGADAGDGFDDPARRALAAQARRCERVDEWLHFMYDGTMRLCCMDYHGEVALPNIQEVSLVDHLRSTRYRRLVDQVRGRVETSPDFICKRCTSPGG